MSKAATTHVPELVTMLEAGVHFGHERSKRNPRMSPYIFTQRNKVAILDLEHTKRQLEEACHFLAGIAAIPSNQILFVGTKRQAQPIVKKYAEAVGMPYVTRRWLGGMLTNFATIQKSIEKLEELTRLEKNEAGAKYTKKEKATRRKEIERLEGILDGTRHMKTLPTAIFLASEYNEQIAVREAKRMGIPVVAIADTNANPDLVEYPIAANDDALRSIDLIVSVVAKTVATARGKELTV